MKTLAACLAFALTLTPLVLHAEDAQPDCKDPQTQADMTQCAADEAADADKALNDQYKATRASQVNLDANLSDDMKGALKALVTAQKAWIAFRDAECDLEGFQAHGGTMEPMLIENCKARLSTERTKQLKLIESGMGD